MSPSRTTQMTRLGRRVAVCPLCQELVASRSAPVFGDGALTAQVLLVGEAPGRHEDKQGRPFVGPAGKVLDELLIEAGLNRSKVYLTNVIKCHPPRNRTPHRGEIANCLPYLHEQIALIKPRVIGALGGVAARALVGANLPLDRLRGRTHEYQGILLVCSYHPAYVRRMPATRAAALRDLRKIREYASTSPASR